MSKKWVIGVMALLLAIPNLQPLLSASAAANLTYPSAVKEEWEYLAAESVLLEEDYALDWMQPVSRLEAARFLGRALKIEAVAPTSEGTESTPVEQEEVTEENSEPVTPTEESSEEQRTTEETVEEETAGEVESDPAAESAETDATETEESQEATEEVESSNSTEETDSANTTEETEVVEESKATSEEETVEQESVQPNQAVTQAVTSIYSDIPVTHPDYPILLELARRGVMSGYADGTFRPTDTLTRGQMSKILTKAFTLSGPVVDIFKDVPTTSVYAPFVYAMLENLITVGYPDRTYRPHETLNRRHFLTFLARALNPAFRSELPPEVVPEPEPEPEPEPVPQSCAKPSSTTTTKIAVQASNLWKQPAKARYIDQPSITNPTDLEKWSASLSTSQSWWLVDYTDTQALYGDKVTVLEQSGNWVRVAAKDQYVPYNSQGYPGWVPASQLTTSKMNYTDCRIAVVHAKTSVLRDVKHGTPVVKVSYSTILPVLREGDTYWVLAAPNDKEVKVSKSDVRVHKSYAAIPKPTPDIVIAEAKRFLGLRYIWSGTTAYGFDCSGILYAIMRTHGRLIPRDSFYQATKGTYISKSYTPRKGDFVFYASGGGTGKIYHVGLYIGDGKMLHAPNASSKVKIEYYKNGVYNYNYWGARRYF